MNKGRVQLKDDDIWFWYKHCMELVNQGIRTALYCKENNLSVTTLNNQKYRVFFCKHTKPDEYKKIVDEYNDFLSNTVKLSEYAKTSDFTIHRLKDYRTHRRYEAVAMEYGKKFGGPYKGMKVPGGNVSRANKPKGPMTFSQVSTPKPIVQEVTKEEVIAVRRDIELIAYSGVRVIISPDVDSTKIMKIIELLKGL